MEEISWVAVHCYNPNSETGRFMRDTCRIFINALLNGAFPKLKVLSAGDYRSAGILCCEEVIDDFLAAVQAGMPCARTLEKLSIYRCTSRQSAELLPRVELVFSP